VKIEFILLNLLIAKENLDCNREYYAGQHSYNTSDTHSGSIQFEFQLRNGYHG